VSDEVRTHPGLVVTFEAGGPTAALPSGRRFRLSPALLGVLAAASAPTGLAELTRAAGIPELLGRRLLDDGLLCPAGTADAAAAGLSGPEWAVQRASGQLRLRAARDPATRPPAVKPADPATVLRLPTRRTRPLDLGELYRRRRSERRFGPGPLPADDLGTLLGETARLRRRLSEDGSSRGHASGGGRHPLELYVCAVAVAGVPPAVYRYAADLDGLQPWRDLPAADLDELLRRANGWTGGMAGRPAAVLIVTAVFARTAWRYEAGALLTVHRDAGCLLQALATSAALLGLAGCPVAGDGEADRARWLGLDPGEESQVGLFLLGPRAGGGCGDSGSDRPGSGGEVVSSCG
jgi:SagB-type dehydrogenase family enzyme